MSQQKLPDICLSVTAGRDAELLNLSLTDLSFCCLSDATDFTNFTSGEKGFTQTWSQEGLKICGKEANKDVRREMRTIRMSF